MTTNTNPATGIRYTVFSANNLNSDLVHELMFGHQANNLSYEAGLEQHLADNPDLHDDDYEHYGEEDSFEGIYEGIKYGLSTLGGAYLLWVYESPLTSKFNLCSPCVPNACDSASPNPDGYEGYDIPADWKNQVTN